MWFDLVESIQVKSNFGNQLMMHWQGCVNYVSILNFVEASCGGESGLGVVLVCFRRKMWALNIIICRKKACNNVCARYY